jgi:hypothetical protein
MRRIVVLIVLVFSGTLAAVIGRRMNTEAMAVVVGVVCGVAAGIPMSLLILAISNRHDARADLDGPSDQARSRYGAYPPVVVIQGGSPMPSQFAPLRESPPALVYDPAPRQFRVIGGEED